MSKFKIKVARIETDHGRQIRVTFQIDRGPTKICRSAVGMRNGTDRRCSGQLHEAAHAIRR
jgi:hypothetical protein